MFHNSKRYLSTHHIHPQPDMIRFFVQLTSLRLSQSKTVGLQDPGSEKHFILTRRSKFSQFPWKKSIVVTSGNDSGQQDWNCRKMLSVTPLSLHMKGMLTNFESSIAFESVLILCFASCTVGIGEELSKTTRCRCVPRRGTWSIPATVILLQPIEMSQMNSWGNHHNHHLQILLLLYAHNAALAGAYLAPLVTSRWWLSHEPSLISWPVCLYSHFGLYYFIFLVKSVSIVPFVSFSLSVADNRRRTLLLVRYYSIGKPYLNCNSKICKAMVPNGILW